MDLDMDTAKQAVAVAKSIIQTKGETSEEGQRALKQVNELLIVLIVSMILLLPAQMDSNHNPFYDLRYGPVLYHQDLGSGIRRTSSTGGT
jgi:hypothetical protein